MTKNTTPQNEPKTGQEGALLHHSTIPQMPLAGLESSTVVNEGTANVLSLKGLPKKNSPGAILRRLDHLPRPIPPFYTPSSNRDAATGRFVREYPTVVPAYRAIETLTGDGDGSSHQEEPPCTGEAKVVGDAVIGEIKTEIVSDAATWPEAVRQLYHFMTKSWLAIMGQMMGCQK